MELWIDGLYAESVDLDLDFLGLFVLLARFGALVRFGALARFGDLARLGALVRFGDLVRLGALPRLETKPRELVTADTSDRSEAGTAMGERFGALVRFGVLRFVRYPRLIYIIA